MTDHRTSRGDLEEGRPSDSGSSDRGFILYSYWRSSASWRVRTVLKLKELSYAYMAVDLDPRVNGQHDPAYARLNALEQVPSLVFERDQKVLTLTQSVAIVEYLNERFPDPPLLPQSAFLRAKVREVVEVINSGIQPLQNLSVLGTIERLGGPEERVLWLKDRIRRGLSAVFGLVRPYAGPYCMGKQLTLADVFLIPQLYAARRFGSSLEGFEALLAIEAECNRLEAFATAHPDQQPDAPAQSPGRTGE